MRLSFVLSYVGFSCVLFVQLASEVQINENCWCCATAKICKFGNFLFGSNCFEIIAFVWICECSLLLKRKGWSCMKT